MKTKKLHMHHIFSRQCLALLHYSKEHYVRVVSFQIATFQKATLHGCFWRWRGIWTPQFFANTFPSKWKKTTTTHDREIVIKERDSIRIFWNNATFSFCLTSLKKDIENLTRNQRKNKIGRILLQLWTFISQVMCNILEDSAKTNSTKWKTSTMWRWRRFTSQMFHLQIGHVMKDLILYLLVLIK